MKEANTKNPTPQKLTDDLKAEEEHSKGLRHFLTAVLKKVAKQAEEWNSFRRYNLMSSLHGPAKNASEGSIAKTSASLPTADPRKEKKDRERGRSGAPNENRDGNKDPKRACNACGRDGHVWEACKVRLGGHPDANPHSHIPWAKSEKGEAWANNPEHPRKTLPTTWTLSGEKLNREGKASRTIVLPLSGDRCTLTCTFKSHHSKTPRKVEVLVDTGSIDLNLISRDCAQQFIQDGSLVEEGKKWRIQSLHGEELANKYVAILLPVRYSNKIEIIPMNATIVDKLPYDFILGRPDIEKYKLLSGRKIPLTGDIQVDHCEIQKLWKKATESQDDGVLYHETHVTEPPTSTQNIRENVEQSSESSSATVTHTNRAVERTSQQATQRRLREGVTPDLSEPSTSFVELGLLDIKRREERLGDKSCNDRGEWVTEDRAETLVTKITQLVEQNVTAQLKTLQEGIKKGQLAQALRSLETQGMCRIDGPRVRGEDLLVDKPRVRGEDPKSTPSYEIIAPVHLLSILGEVPDLEAYCAKMHTIEGKRVHVSELIDSIDDNDEIDYSKEETPWEQSHDVNVDFTFGEDAKAEEVAKVKELLEKYDTVFSNNLTKQPAKLTPLQLKVDESRWKVPQNRRAARPQSMLKNLEIKNQVTKMLDVHLIQPSQAAEKSQVVLAKKPDGTWRFCIDYRALNDATESMGWPIPNIPEMFQRIGAKRPKFFAVMDLTKGFFQAPLDEKSRKYTTFTTWMGNYEFLRVPMGIKGAPPWFQQMIGKVLSGLLHHCCELYIDDVIIFGETFEEFLMNLKQVLDRFRDHGIIVSPKKCKFLMSSIEYLGHKIDEEGISFSQSQKAPVLNFPVPTKAGQLKQFLGMAVYFHSHVKDFSRLAQPLHSKLGKYNKAAKNKVLDLNEEEIEAFVKLQKAIDECPLLYFPDPQAEVILETDASDYGVGAYLYQKDPAGGENRPIAFISKTLQGSQRNWSVPGKEAYAIFHALQKLEHLLRDAFSSTH